MTQVANGFPKIVLVGPYPPPHGGISVHVRNAHAILRGAGIQCEVLDSEMRRSGRWTFFARLASYAYDDCLLHVHTNGHNYRSWLVALAGGVAAQFSGGGLLTLHSGFVPQFLRSGPHWRRVLACLACMLYDRVVCVNGEIAEAVRRIGLPNACVKVLPAYLPGPVLDLPLPQPVALWLNKRRPIVSTVLAFRPEYGFDLLVHAVERLRRTHGQIGCLVMGDGKDRSGAEDLVRRQGLSDAMMLTGDVDHDLCLALMSRSDLFVRTTYRDGDANSVREALSAGIPVVASNVGVRPEGTTLFEPGDLEGLVASLEKCLSAGARMRTDDAPSFEVQRLMDLYAAGGVSAARAA